MRWILTRPVEGDDLGLTVVPCIERHPLPWPPYPPGRLLVFVTSPTVAKHLATHPPPQGTRIAAVSPATSALLKQVDLVEPGGAVALAHAVLAWASEPYEIFYPTSDAGTQQPEQEEAITLLETLHTVHRHVVYEVRAPKGLSLVLPRLEGCGFVFYSPSAVKHFAEAGGVPAAAICFGASTLRAYEAHEGWPKAVLAHRHEDVAAAVRAY